MPGRRPSKGSWVLRTTHPSGQACGSSTSISSASSLSARLPCEQKTTPGEQFATLGPCVFISHETQPPTQKTWPDFHLRELRHWRRPASQTQPTLSGPGNKTTTRDESFQEAWDGLAHEPQISVAPWTSWSQSGRESAMAHKETKPTPRHDAKSSTTPSVVRNPHKNHCRSHRAWIM